MLLLLLPFHHFEYFNLNEWIFGVSSLHILYYVSHLFWYLTLSCLARKWARVNMCRHFVYLTTFLSWTTRKEINTRETAIYSKIIFCEFIRKTMFLARNNLLRNLMKFQEFVKCFQTLIKTWTCRFKSV